MVGIISAMEEEVSFLLKELKNTTTTTKGRRNYYYGELFNKQVVIVFSRWGKVAAATTATQLINDFKLSEIIFTGVAGAINNNLNIGDIVIGENLIQHDLDASPFFDRFHIPILNIDTISTKNTRELQAATDLFLNNFNNHIIKSEAEEFNITIPKSMTGDIASGDQFIADNKKIQHLKDMLPTVTCVEMEGAAVAQVCFEYQVPFSIIRVISDKANENADIDFTKFINSLASKYALGILKNYLN